MDAHDPITRCPFCAEPAARTEEVGTAAWAVVCQACGGIGPVGHDAAESMFLWDSRAALAANLGLLRAV